MSDEYEEYYQLSDSDGEIRVRDSSTNLTLVFPGPELEADLRTINAGVAAHDPDRALEVVNSLTSVERVLESLGQRAMKDCEVMPYEPADLDLVMVGCWGQVVYVHDAGLAGDLVDYADTEVWNQQRLHPQASIVSKVFLDMVADYMQLIFWLPGLQPVTTEWSDGFRVKGDVPALLRAAGVDESADLSDLSELDFQGLARQICGFAPYMEGPEALPVSLFRVGRPEDVIEEMEDVWIR
ncbi:DUF6333 family protein [Nonomuraea purpurea]|uniref:DUF6333 family protein n=1 Tax=Nonomuraea purpurea TaxID=1849276 RepID=A0ABV8GIL6_9ACTN